MKSLLLAFALIAVAATDAHAQFGIGAVGYGGYGNFYNRSIYADQDRLPYFALHPPVYYSYPVPRPYGYSPFAYPGIVPTPEFQTQESAVLLNPHMNEAPGSKATTPAPTTAPQLRPQQSKTTVKPSADQVGRAPQPLRIMNPYAGDVQVVSGR